MICIRLSYFNFIIALNPVQKTYPVIPSLDQTSFNMINSLPCTLNVKLDPLFSDNTLANSTSNMSYNLTINPYQNAVFEAIPAVDYSITATGCMVGRTRVQFPPIEYLSNPGKV